MARDGSGNYTRVAGPYTGGTTILKDNINDEMDDLGNEVSNSINKAGTKAFAGNQPMGGFKLTGLGAGASNGDSVRYEQLTALSATYQPLDATLTALAAGTTGADVLFYWSGTDTLSTTTLTSAARSVLDDTTVAAMLTTLGLSANGASLATAANYAAMRALLDLEAGTDFVALTGGAYSGDVQLATAPASLATNSAGFRGLGVRNDQNASYTFVLGDAGLNVYHFTGTHAWTIPPNSSVAFPIGACIHVFNEAGTLTIVEGSGVTLYKGDGSGFTTGTRTITVGAGGTLWKVNTNVWILEGTFT